MNPSCLATLVPIGSNEKLYMPVEKAIFQRYLRKFSMHDKLLEASLGLEMDEAPAAV